MKSVKGFIIILSFLLKPLSLKICKTQAREFKFLNVLITPEAALKAKHPEQISVIFISVQDRKPEFMLNRIMNKRSKGL